MSSFLKHPSRLLGLDNECLAHFVTHILEVVTRHRVLEHDRTLLHLTLPGDAAIQIENPVLAIRQPVRCVG